ncbi:MAG: hypothetical protein LBV08_09090 [Clostridiales bacterium]|jgi:hypothetical protein|nr:hypothetical protein [Clostridiales bacterium]
MRKLIIIILIALLCPEAVSAMAEETIGLNVSCIDGNGNILEEYKLYGGQYEKIKIQAPVIENYMVIGADYKFATFDINDKTTFIYTKAEEWQKGWQLHPKYISGYESGYFMPDKEITWPEAIVMLYNIYEVYKPSVANWEGPWYKGAEDYFLSKGFGEFFNGQGYAPDKLMSRYEFISLASLYIDDCVNDSIIDAFLQTNNMSRLQNITRAESVCIINMLLSRDNLASGQEGYSMGFADVPESHKLYKSVMEAAVTHKCISEDEAEVWLGK